MSWMHNYGNVWVTIYYLNHWLSIVHPVVWVIYPVHVDICTKCISCCVALDLHVHCLCSMPFLFDKRCVLCLVKNGFWIHGSQVTLKRISCNKFISSPSICNVQLPLAKKPFHKRHLCYATASRIEFWYFYNSLEMPLHEPATCSHF